MAVAIKFCGLTRRSDVEAAEALEAEYVGVVFAGGPRRQTVESAEPLLGGGTARRVGVFLDADGSAPIARAVERLPITIAQLHADPSIASVRSARTAGAEEVWAVVRIAGCLLSHGAIELFRDADAVVLDTASSTGMGGTGHRFDWAAIAGALTHVPRSARLVLAGGLRPDNVAEAIRVLRPDVVDVSSGVEVAPGIKDVDLMRRFVDAARSA